MKNVKLPEGCEKYYFNCFEQQIMALCYFYHKEFWKLFLNHHLEMITDNVTKIEDTIKYVNDVKKNAEKYYGVFLKEIKNVENISFREKEIYLAYINTEYYPFTMDLQEKGVHCVLIYGENLENFIVNDNYYNQTEYLFDKKLYTKGIVKLYLVEYYTQNISRNNEFTDFIDTISFSSYMVAKNSYDFIKKSRMCCYESASLINLINRISCMIKRDEMITKVWQPKNVFLEKCRNMISKLANEQRKMYYELLKSHLKFGIIPEELLYIKLEKILAILYYEEKIKSEIANILLNNDSVKSLLHEQILEYLDAEEFNENISVYEMHDKLSIIYLINYLEDENKLTELVYDDFKECTSYLDFELVVYEKIFMRDILGSK